MEKTRFAFCKCGRAQGSRIPPYPQKLPACIPEIAKHFVTPPSFPPSLTTS